MKEIKFRAWNKDIKEMFQVGQITLEKGIWDYQPDNRKHIGVCIPYQPSFILMQYTGLHDKNGKEIYEGDIVKKETFDDESPNRRKVSYAKVGYLEAVSGYYLLNKNNKIYWDLASDRYNIEVCGNVFENEELLNETN